MQKKTKEYEFELSEVLALDMAGKAGFYSQKDNGGIWLIDTKTNEFSFLYDTLKEYIINNGIKQIVMEDVSVGTFFKAMRKLSEYRGVVRLVNEQLGLYPIIYVNPSTVKKSFTGDGKASKDKMVRTCQTKYGLTPVDDNHADAFAIFMYHQKNPKKR